MLRWVHLAVFAIGFGGAACEATPPSPPMSRAEVPLVQEAAPTGAPKADPAWAQSYDLEADERRGGHTLARHVGKSDADLRARLQQESRISAASTYTDRATAERVVAHTLQRNRVRVDQWLGREGPRPNLAIDYHGKSGNPIGRSLTRRGRQPVACTDAVVVLRWDGDGFYVLTSYPEASR